jgi:hypothetical protein
MNDIEKMMDDLSFNVGALLIFCIFVWVVIMIW